MSFWLLALIVIGSGVAFYLLLGLWAHWSVRRGPPCPSCGARLHLVDMHKWSGHRDGQRTGGATSFYRCPRCAGRFKAELKGPLDAVTDDTEWPERET